MAWLPTGLTAIVVCDHGSVKPTGVRAGDGRRGHLPATTAEVRATAMRRYTVTPGSSNASNAALSGQGRATRTHGPLQREVRRPLDSRCSHDHGLLYDLIRPQEHRLRDGET